MVSDNTIIIVGVILIVGALNIWDSWHGTEKLGYEGADGHTITLHNNKTAVNPTYARAFNFILFDITSAAGYTNDFQCGDFAELVHNRAEEAGFECGWVSIQFENDSVEHACNAFNTSDRGIVFFDCTQGDSTVEIIKGKDYIPAAMPTISWGSGIVESNTEYESVGTVKSYHIYW